MTDRSTDPAPLASVPAPRPPLDGRELPPDAGGLDVAVRHRSADSVACVTGELDIATARRFLAAFDELSARCARADGSTGWTVWCDLSGLGFVSASGVTVLETAHRVARERGVTLQFVACSGPVRRVLSLVGSPLASSAEETPGRATR